MDAAILALVFLFSFVESYKPVVLVHGVLSDGSELNDLKKQIIQAHSGTDVIILKYYSNLESLETLKPQVEYVTNELENIMAENPDGIHLVCHSQGGVVCLGFLESSSNHNVHSMVILSSPLYGQFGVPKEVLNDVPILKPIANLSRELVTPLFYSPFFQNILSIANYWKDPRFSYKDEYERHVVYLPLLLNDPNSKWYNEQDALKRKKNFLRLKKLVLIGGPDDGTIIPWQSTLFGYYDNDIKTIIPMSEQKVFLEDWFGLKTLHARNEISMYIFPNVHHKKWHSNKTVFIKAIEPWLI